MLILACAFGILCSVIGYYFAKLFDVSVAGAISAAIGAIFAIVFIITSSHKSKMDVISD
jgi:manganese/zinc/iron transport system permease protein